MILTGADGMMKYAGGTCVKVRNWSLTITRDAIDVSCLNTYDREFVVWSAFSHWFSNAVLRPQADQRPRAAQLNLRRQL